MSVRHDESALRHRLLCRIKRRYQVVTSEVRIGRLCFPFTRITDPDRVLDEVAAEADLRDRLHGRQADGNQLHLPYWAELWDSAMGMGKYLEGSEEEGRTGEGASGRWGKDEWVPERAEGTSRESAVMSSSLASTPPHRPLAFSPSPPLSGLSVLDLGCGMGMAGTVAAALGACVTFGDLEPPALLFAQLNSLPWRRRVWTRQLNWQTDHVQRRFDLILGADILYERAQWVHLEPFWRAHLKEGGRVLLGEPGRQTGDMFPEWIHGRGWNLQLTDVPVDTRPRPIRLFILGRKDAQ